MEFITTKEASKKWNISERRIRQLLKDGRMKVLLKMEIVGIFHLML